MPEQILFETVRTTCEQHATSPETVRHDGVMTNGDAPGFRTRSVHAGGRPDPATGARAVPIYQTSSYVFGDTDEAANLFALQTYGHIYSRISNPTVAAFEERVASLEGGLGAIGTSSGQAAEFLTLAALAGQGDHIVSSAQLYGGTRTLMEVTLARFGVETTFLPEPEPDAVAAAISPSTQERSMSRRSPTRPA